MKLHTFKLEEGIFLDGNKIEGVRSYKIVQEKSSNIANLTLEMDVKILANETGSDFKSPIKVPEELTVYTMPTLSDESHLKMLQYLYGRDYEKFR